MNVLVAVILALLTFALRVADHPWNVAPTAAAMLFAGAILPRRWGWIAPLAGSLAADAIIGWYTWQIALVVYGSFIAIWAASAFVARVVGRSGTSTMRRAAILSLAGSVGFFLTTNWAAWMWTEMYPPTWAGLVASYAAGIPFFRNTLLGDLLFSGTFFGCYAAAVWVGNKKSALMRGVFARVGVRTDRSPW